MIGLIVKAILWIINQAYNVLMAPVIAVLAVSFPDMRNFYEAVTSWIYSSVNYVVIARDLLLIPIPVITTVMTYYLLKFTIFTTLLAYKFAVNIYDRFKP